MLSGSVIAEETGLDLQVFAKWAQWQPFIAGIAMIRRVGDPVMVVGYMARRNIEERL